MKKALLLAGICAILLAGSCNNNNEKEGTHKHDDGSTHAAHDTTKPVQQEFNITDSIKKDTSTHTHDDGKKHDH